MFSDSRYFLGNPNSRINFYDFIKMLSNYKVFVFISQHEGTWENIEYVEKNCIYNLFSYYYCGSNDIDISKTYYEGEINIYQFDDMEIKIPKNINLNLINPSKKFEIFTMILNKYLIFLVSSYFKNKNYLIFSENVFIKLYYYLIYYKLGDLIYKNKKYIIKNEINIIFTKMINKYLLFLLSSSFKNNYLIFSENTFIKMRQYLIYYKYNIFPIYKNGKYIVKNEFNINYYYERISCLTIYESIDIIYYIISIFGNKYYADNDRLTLIKFICDKINIEYENINNGIKI